MTCHLSVLDAQTAAPNRHTQRVSLEDEDDDDDYDGTRALTLSCRGNSYTFCRFRRDKAHFDRPLRSFAVVG